MFAPADATTVVWNVFDAIIFAALAYSLGAVVINAIMCWYELRLLRLKRAAAEMRAADADSRENPRQEPIEPIKAMKINDNAK
jgi:hypothetical protein